MTNKAPEHLVHVTWKNNFDHLLSTLSSVLVSSVFFFLSFPSFVLVEKEKKTKEKEKEKFQHACCILPRSNT